MNRKLYYYGGNGFEMYPEFGQYEVHHGEIIKKFNQLSESKNYYESIDDEKSCWSVDGFAELIECHEF